MDKDAGRTAKRGSILPKGIIKPSIDRPAGLKCREGDTAEEFEDV